MKKKLLQRNCGAQADRRGAARVSAKAASSASARRPAARTKAENFFGAQTAMRPRADPVRPRSSRTCFPRGDRIQSKRSRRASARATLARMAAR